MTSSAFERAGLGDQAELVIRAVSVSVWRLFFPSPTCERGFFFIPSLTRRAPKTNSRQTETEKARIVSRRPGESAAIVNGTVGGGVVTLTGADADKAAFSVASTIDGGLGLNANDDDLGQGASTMNLTLSFLPDPT